MGTSNIPNERDPPSDEKPGALTVVAGSANMPAKIRIRDSEATPVSIARLEILPPTTPPTRRPMSIMNQYMPTRAPAIAAPIPRPGLMSPFTMACAASYSSTVITFLSLQPLPVHLADSSCAVASAMPAADGSAISVEAAMKPSSSWLRASVAVSSASAVASSSATTAAMGSTVSATVFCAS